MYHYISFVFVNRMSKFLMMTILVSVTKVIMLYRFWSKIGINNGVYEWKATDGE